jgi:DNA invertase Pin-like site-specific DNA recombinase
MANRNSTLRVAIYARVSTCEQSTDSQLQDLRRYWRACHCPGGGLLLFHMTIAYLKESSG